MEGGLRGICLMRGSQGFSIQRRFDGEALWGKSMGSEERQITNVGIDKANQRGKGG